MILYLWCYPIRLVPNSPFDSKEEANSIRRGVKKKETKNDLCQTGRHALDFWIGISKIDSCRKMVPTSFLLFIVQDSER